MCGIAGIISKHKVEDRYNRIKNMENALIHRGPDAGNSIEIDQYAAFAHRRLKIIDTSDTANQPMVSSNGNFLIVFNGEIYNFKQIKKEIPHYNYKTNCDTEVILAAIQEHGIDWLLERANGMYAIAIYDKATKKTYLIRDRLGVKPLFYYIDESKLVFGSEIKAILNSGLIEAELNLGAIDNYLAYRYVREPYTFFKNIYQLKSATYLEIDEELKTRECSYWQLPKLNFNPYYDEDNILQELKLQIENSVKLRMISDVTLGTYLSGGVDSSLITAITAKNSNTKLNTYVIGFNEEGYNEFKYARLVAEKFKTNHHEINVDITNYLNLWEDLITYRDSPLGVPNEIPLAIMSKRLKEDITVVLSGEGADELFGGYGKIYRAAFDYYNENTNLTFHEYFKNKYEYIDRGLRDNLLNIDSSLREEFDKIDEKDSFSDFREEESIFRFFYNCHIKGLLSRLDMTTMYASVEGRVPFVDYKLIEHVFTKIPYELKLKWNSSFDEAKAKNLNSSVFSEKLDTPKYILKKLSYDYLPAEVIEREKMGFPVPLNNWFSDLANIAADKLKNSFWINSESLNRLINEAKNHSRSGQILWMLINIQLFIDKYFTRSWLY